MTKSAKENISKKVMIPLAILCVGLAAWSFWSVTKKGKTVNSLHTTANSLSICFERAGQSFMAVMLKDFTNDYVGNSFLEKTGDCFEELKESLEAMSITWARGVKKFNYLMTDYHWYAEEVQKAAANDMALSDEENIKNVMSYYQKVENHKNKLMDLMEKKENTIANNSNLAILFSFSIGLFLFLFFYALRKNTQALEATVQTATEADWVDTVERLSEKKEGLIRSSQTSSDDLFNLDDLATPEVYKNSESLNLNLIATGVASLLGNKAFAYGIMMDFDISEDLYVRGEEDSINQLFYSLVIYLMSGLQEKQGQRRIKIHAKGVGEKVELIVKADGLRFNKEELNFINLQSVKSEDILEGELKVCREIVMMSDLSLKLVNGMIDSEGYAKFILRMRKGEPKKLFINDSTSLLAKNKRDRKPELTLQ